MFKHSGLETDKDNFKDKAIQSKISPDKYGAIQFEALENANTFKRFYF